ncbi:flavin reductase family protein [Novosphingobium sp. TH158]|uniref:flavin reductase family protein n=1 Tax=Novosphingobium sp. TH158 TaxID=2067455 RepID=UPI000C7CD20F|nr:flavin reductase family protein [Novosphingobium sp. TH158]PLK26140.1 monooxygenase [Novosphingobium sp. TH158]
MAGMAIESAKFRQVLGNYPTGVAVITAPGPQDAPVGMVVGTFTSVSLDPPLVGFLPDKRSSTWPMIEQAGHFCVNVLARDQLELCAKLAKSGPDKFTGVQFELSEHNLPVLAGSMVSIECRLHAVQEAGDHWFVTGLVLGLESHRETDPMLFHRGQYGGFSANS